MKRLLIKAPFELKSLDFNEVAREAVEFLSSLAAARKVEMTSFVIPIGCTRLSRTAIA